MKRCTLSVAVIAIGALLCAAATADEAESSVTPAVSFPSDFVATVRWTDEHDGTEEKGVARIFSGVADQRLRIDIMDPDTRETKEWIFRLFGVAKEYAINSTGCFYRPLYPSEELPPFVVPGTARLEGEMKTDGDDLKQYRVEMGIPGVFADYLVVQKPDGSAAPRSIDYHLIDDTITTVYEDFSPTKPTEEDFNILKVTKTKASACEETSNLRPGPNFPAHQGRLIRSGIKQSEDDGNVEDETNGEKPKSEDEKKEKEDL